MTTKKCVACGEGVCPLTQFAGSIAQNAEKKAERRNTMNIRLSSIECTPATTRQKYSIIPARSVGKNSFLCEFQKIFAVSAVGKNGELRRQNVRVRCIPY